MPPVDFIPDTSPFWPLLVALIGVVMTIESRRASRQPRLGPSKKAFA